MTAQPVNHHGAPYVPNTVEGIRAALPEKLRAAFQAELGEAVDAADLARLDAVKGKWWAQALWNVDPSIREDFALLDSGHAQFAPNPFAAR
jgi:hypothetical protein